MANFKAIIIGGGPAGLAMAHCLRLAEIDYVLFERRDSITDPEGAAISIMPHVARILHQLGMFNDVLKLGSPMRSTVHVNGDDKGWRDDGGTVIAEKFGYNVMLFERYQLVDLLLRSLPDHHQRIKTSKGVKSIQERDDGVSVTLEDGSVEHGSIVIGADGVHSKVRQLLSEMHPGDIDAAPFTSFTHGLYGHGPRTDAFHDGEIVERHSDGWAFQTLTGGDRTYYFIYKTLAEPTKERKRFTKADAAEFVKPYLDETIIGDITFEDLWKGRDVGNLRHLEQGISRVWSRGRVVLLGDSVHKVTPNLGAGGNMGIESAVCLANHLHALLLRRPCPDTTSLSQTFHAYREQRIEVVETWYNIAYAQMKFLTLETDRHKKAFDKASENGLQSTSRSPPSDRYLRGLRQGITLNYVPFESELSGTCPWADGTPPALDPRPKL
ncbi:hypothetical protein SUNI508_13557 [Seiridium unicorne]|uniref:FAD-binding domain-containing protein n=1 Tax=Seiridium unicorne TaxID=138068 RepID=A0ABR2VCR0_9PEZI